MIFDDSWRTRASALLVETACPVRERMASLFRTLCGSSANQPTSQLEDGRPRKTKENRKTLERTLNAGLMARVTSARTLRTRLLVNTGYIIATLIGV